MVNFSKYYFLSILSLLSFSISATNYYCDPANGNMNNSGTSVGNAWTTLADVFARGKNFQSGDIIYLMNGAHGRSYIAKSNTGYVTIKALEGHNPKLGSIQFGTASYWAFDGLIFTADGTGGDFRTNFVSTGTSTTYIKITNSTFYMEEDSSSWTFDDWYAKTKNRSYHGLRLKGDYFIFNNNHVKNVYFGLLIESSNIELKNNIIENFGADAIQMQNCSNVLIESNIIRNAYLEDYGQNHDDAIQFLGLSATLDNIVIIKNKVYNFIDPITQDMIDNNLVSYQMQGIFLTDGKITNSLIENNLVVIDTYHGITLNNSNNTRIQNNTVFRTPTNLNPQNIRPWIMQYTGKGGTHTNGVIRNNIAQQYSIVSGNILENNLTISSSSADNYFSDYSIFDFTLKENSPAIEAGVNTDLSDTDLAGNNRLTGTYVDCGAYEYSGSLNVSVGSFVESLINVYPTFIADNNLTLELDKKLVGDIFNFKIITIDGRIVEGKYIKVLSNKQTLNFDKISSLKSGLFILRITNDAIKKDIKLMKK